ncbi:MAG: hypothetical protein WBA13_18615 [Microcoleaceae cyanobacterium]
MKLFGSGFAFLRLEINFVDDDGVALETQRYKLQMDIIIDVLISGIEQRLGGDVGGNMFLSFSMTQVGNLDFQWQSLFAILGVPKLRSKKYRHRHT